MSKVIILEHLLRHNLKATCKQHLSKKFVAAVDSEEGRVQEKVENLKEEGRGRIERRKDTSSGGRKWRIPSKEGGQRRGSVRQVSVTGVVRVIPNERQEEVCEKWSNKSGWSLSWNTPWLDFLFLTSCKLIQQKQLSICTTYLAITS